MKKTNTFRKMTPKDIQQAFETMIENEAADMMIEFVQLYPHFTETYVNLLLKKLFLINTLIAAVRNDE